MVELSELTVKCSDPNRAERVVRRLKKWGVVIITEVFSVDKCGETMDTILDNIMELCPKVNIETEELLRETWYYKNLVPQTRAGLFQSVFSYLAWDIRQDPEIHKIFKECYSILRNEKIKETVTSIDGINIKPPIKPFYNENDEDWAHLDQTKTDNIYECIQGQVVLTNTDACFRCSPKSHLLLGKILKMYNVLGKSDNWLKFDKGDYKKLSKMVRKIGGEWQKEIIAPSGSLILWLSSTIHSAKLQSEIEDADFLGVDPENPWCGWRGIIYVCQRPRNEVNATHIKRLQNAVLNIRTTNHWGNRVFPLKPRFFLNTKYDKTIYKLIDNLENSGDFGVLTPLGRKLIGL